MTKKTPSTIALVIVESPAKAKTIQKYLGKDYIVKASVGHIKDLPKNKLGVDVDKKFKCDYQIIPTKLKVLEELKTAAKKVNTLFLATDPDREGEAIAWHIKEELAKKGKTVHRVLFNAITKKDVTVAIANPTTLSLLLYEAQQARRILDRLVGYKISPLLWEKVKRGSSAGRVQSVALRLITEREHEIKIFQSEEYWSIEGDFIDASVDNPSLVKSKLFKINHKDPEICSEKEAKAMEEALKKATWKVSLLEEKERQRKPQPPFTTSRLQQDASTRLGFSAKKTMTLAQKLYEGIHLGEQGTHGLITYMRTDSVRSDPQAIQTAREYIQTTYGKQYLPEHANIYKAKDTAQNAHEAIRPASLEFSPQSIDGALEPDMMRLYQLIWTRFIASQMNPAIYDQFSMEFESVIPHSTTPTTITFRSNLSNLKFAGYTKVYHDNPAAEDHKSTQKKFPKWTVGKSVSLVDILLNQHFTAPPPRFNDASLIKELEEKGIGRPSTYASIISNLQDREYVEKRENKFFPNELGIVVSDLLTQSFPDIINVEFTAGMEKQLDEIEHGKEKIQTILKKFWKFFETNLLHAKEQMKNIKQQTIITDIPCDKCAGQMAIRWGKAGSFLACTAYPECKNTHDFTKDDAGKIIVTQKQYSDSPCPKCNSSMVIKNSKYGRFIACSNYPQCKTTTPFTLEIPCPKCAVGKICEKQSIRFKKIFYSCSTWPACDFATWDKPVQKACPECKNPIMVDKTTKKHGRIHKCPQKACDYFEFVNESGRAL